MSGVGQYLYAQWLVSLNQNVMRYSGKHWLSAKITKDPGFSVLSTTESYIISGRNRSLRGGTTNCGFP